MLVYVTYRWPLKSKYRSYSIEKKQQFFFVVKIFKHLVILFSIKLYTSVSIFSKIDCIRNAIFYVFCLSKLLSICTITCRNLSCSQKLVATHLMNSQIYNIISKLSFKVFIKVREDIILQHLSTCMHQTFFTR